MNTEEILPEDTSTAYAVPVLRLFLLGGFRVERAGEVVPDSSWQRRLARKLIKVLAVHPDHRLHREELMSILCPDVPPRAAAISLRQALHSARHTIEPELQHQQPSSYISTSADMLALNENTVWIDADEFQRRADEALNSQSIQLCEATLCTFTGSLLPEDRYEDWALFRYHAVEDKHLRLLLHVAHLSERNGDCSTAIERLQQVLAIEPTREDIHRDLMRLYAQMGSRHRAHRQYQLCRQILQSELDVVPEQETETLHRAILSGKPVSPTQQEGTPSPTALPRSIRHLSSTTFVGRDHMLDMLEGALERTVTGTGDVIIIGGEAGVGKSRLAAEIGRRAHSRGATVLWGTGYEQERRLPYGVFVEALDSYAGSLSHADRETLALRHPDLAAIVPALRTATESRAPVAEAITHEGHRSRLIASIIQLLTNLRAAGPLLMVLDDLHAVDSESLSLFHQLARLSHDSGWFIIGTYREEDVAPGSELQRLCSALTRQDFCHRIDLLRLGRQDCHHLIASLCDGQVDEELSERLYTLTLGNPLFVSEMVRSVQEDGYQVQEGRPWNYSEPVPQRIRDLVETRVQRMDSDVRLVLSLASAAPARISFAVLAAASGLDEDRLIDALDRTLDVKLLDERDDGYVFRHPLLRAAIYERVSRTRKVHLHRAIAQALEISHEMTGNAGPEDVETLAIQFSRAQVHDRASRYRELAGDRARHLFANAAAEHHYRTALSHLRLVAAPQRSITEATLQEKLGGVLTTLARYDEALDVFEEAAQEYKRLGDEKGLQRVTVHRGRVHALRGTYKEGLDLVAPLVASANQSTDASEPAIPHAVLAQLYFGSGRYKQGYDAAQRSSDLARASGDDVVLAEAEQWRGTLLSMLGHVPDGIKVLEQAIVLTERVGDLLNLSRALNNAAELHEASGNFERSDSYYRRSLDAAQKLGDPARIALALTRCGNNSFRRGHWEQARRNMEEASELLSDIHTSWVAPYVYLALGRLASAEGNWQSAGMYLQKVVDLTTANGDPQALRAAISVLAEHDIKEGRAADAYQRLYPLLFRPETEEQEVTYLLPLAARALLDLGRDHEAQMLAATALEQTTAQNDLVALVDVLRVRALLAWRRHEWQDAQGDLERALEITRRTVYPLHEAQTLWDMGAMYRARGDIQKCRTALQAAASIFERLGARADAAEIQERLATLTA